MVNQKLPSSQELTALAKFIRYDILVATTNAKSGHPSSCLSATDLMTALVFGGFYHFNINQPGYANNDRLIFSKGHAAPLLYALWVASGEIEERQLLTLRQFGSPLEGHPTMFFPYTEAATGSLGQGLAIGVGFALNAKYLDKLPYKTYVLLGDSEMSEGSNWEAIQLATHYKLGNLVGIIDVNRLGQRGETMDGYNLEAYQKRLGSFGWKTLIINGHSFGEIIKAFQLAQKGQDQPVMIIAKTVKGKGISFLEDQEGWHGKALSRQQLKKALKELGRVDTSIKGQIAQPVEASVPQLPQTLLPKPKAYKEGELIATRKAYGEALVKIGARFPQLVVLDGEVSNSTYSETFKITYPDRFFEMFIAEQNMVGVALGLSRRGKIPFVSTFAAFLTRAFDQIRMSQYSLANIKFVGSHAGVAIGEDGPSQMGLEDIAMFRALLNSVILYPADAAATEKLVEEAAKHFGLVYLRTTRNATPVIYSHQESFPIGGSKTLKQTPKDRLTIVAAGVTLFEALKAHTALEQEGIPVRVIDLYSLKPLDQSTLEQAARETHGLLTVEDHYPAGGLGEAVASALSHLPVPLHSLAVTKMPKSGSTQQLLDYEGISSQAIVAKVKAILGSPGSD